MMKVMTYSESRKGADFVSSTEYESMNETSFLLQSPANARVLKERIDRLEKGLSVQNALIEENE
ncbi:hypothetical protein HMPREF3171_09700 [Corynebacterium sp. HMSC08F01]|nr:hypothetical protein HMPREF2734_07815 [Corynebacterium sp. HMSC055D05]OFT27916.1 hypothetical protein HMPREF3171_09700 [Corynebacterium sp. HMSC08F01]OHO32067.1 hypothetical protein HMPREF2656_06730 [Corynebacterium sp. HMSC034B08]OHO34157.1 hypothetical protein HMPREF2690_03985 [Corynebacterium sp. HMSC034E11]OHO82014.1 hypothetical protein HMPREF2736_04240 [Corynebacterium sp. HMSC036E10]